jgi:hypothetical protein
MHQVFNKKIISETIDHHIFIIKKNKTIINYEIRYLIEATIKIATVLSTLISI